LNVLKDINITLYVSNISLKGQGHKLEFERKTLLNAWNDINN